MVMLSASCGTNLVLAPTEFYRPVRNLPVPDTLYAVQHQISER